MTLLIFYSVKVGARAAQSVAVLVQPAAQASSGVSVCDVFRVLRFHDPGYKAPGCAGAPDCLESSVS